MQNKLFSGIKNMIFNVKKPQEMQMNQKVSSKIIDFGDSKDEEKRKHSTSNIQMKITYSEDNTVDIRYLSLDKLPDLKELGLHKNQIHEGEIAVLAQTRFILCKIGKHYQQAKLIVTNYKVAILPGKSQYRWFPLAKIEKMQKYVDNEKDLKISIALKDGRAFKFRICTQGTWKKIYEKIQVFSHCHTKTFSFPFRFYHINPQLEMKYQGWKLYDPEKQYKRMGIQIMEHTKENNKKIEQDFKILDNSQGKICSTYPAYLVVPSRVPYEAFIECAKYRSRGRIPALSYAYQYSPGKFSCIYRSSQTYAGLQNSRSPADQLILKFIGNHRHDNQDGTYNGPINCKIFDARNYMAAFGNRINGKGYQSEDFYKNCQIEFLNIPNIHAVRDSYQKMIKASFGEDLKFYPTMADSLWYDYVFLILTGAKELAKNLLRGLNNLVHCSDGWDRTAQLCSLAGIIVDPYYRTLQGLAVLIEKDWVHFGHQFSTRLGQAIGAHLQQRSQVFIQFLDCVSQIMYQYPSQFEFNYKYLQEIGELAYSGMYGTFLCNNQLQMEQLNTPRKTISLWSYTQSVRDKFLNPFYYPSEKILNISTAQKNMRFFKQHFLQHVDGFGDIYDIYSCKFTQENLQVMHRQLKKQKQLLIQRLGDNSSILQELNDEIKKKSEQQQQQKNQSEKNILKQYVDPEQEANKVQNGQNGEKGSKISGQDRQI